MTDLKHRAKAVGTTKTILSKWSCQDRFERGMGIINSVCQEKKLRLKTAEILNTKIYKSTRFTRVAGMASHSQNYIILHQGLFDMADPLYHDRLDTFFHELSHIISDKTFGYMKNGHNDYWKFTFSCFGFIPHERYDGTKTNYRGYKQRVEDRFDNAIGAAFDGVEF